MLFRRLILCALLVGALAGLLLSAVQRFQVVPLIAAAERYEAAREAASAQTRVPAHGEPGHDHVAHHAAPVDHAAHEHAPDAAAWEPADGVERTAFTALANVLTASGFALLLLATLAGLQVARGAAPASVAQGLLWGLAGYLSFFVAPAFGLPPEIPGAEGAALEVRQVWWALAVVSTAGGLAWLAFGRGLWRWAGLLPLVLPHLIGAPPVGDAFAAHPPAAAAELGVLAARFVVASAVANAVYWLALGSFAAWVFRRWLGALVPTPSVPR